MTPRAQRKPRFFWQGLLILLPVALMAAIGLTAILRDRAAVEHDAQQRAGEILRQLASELAGGVAGQLSEFDLSADDWNQYHRTWLATWTRRSSPPSDPRARVFMSSSDLDKSQTGLDVDPFPRAGERFARWQTAYPGLDPAQVFPNRLSFAANEDLPESPDDRSPPVPPPWFVGLSSEQRQAWDALRHAQLAHGGSNVVEAAVRRFLDLHPPAEGIANAEFVRHQHGPASAAWPAFNFLLFAQAHRGVATESGLPLSSLAISEALSSVASSSSLAGVLDALLDEFVKAPSFLMPNLLDQARSLIRHAPEPR